MYVCLGKHVAIFHKHQTWFNLSRSIEFVLSFFVLFSSVMFWSNEHEVLLCREVVNLNPFTSKKGSTQRSGMWEKIAQILNEYTALTFSVDKWSVRDHVEILVNKHKMKVRAEGKASGIALDEPRASQAKVRVVCFQAAFQNLVIVCMSFMTASEYVQHAETVISYYTNT